MIHKREFSYWISPAEVTKSGRHITLSVDAESRQALAQRFNIEALSRFDISAFVFMVGKGPNIRLQGRFEADIVQNCTITLDSIKTLLSESFEGEFGPVTEEVDLELSLSDKDPVEAFEAQGIDLGELAAQYLGLALDPYPRADGVRLEDIVHEKNILSFNNQKALNNPFAALEVLKTASKISSDKC